MKHRYKNILPALKRPVGTKYTAAFLLAIPLGIKHWYKNILPNLKRPVGTKQISIPIIHVNQIPDRYRCNSTAKGCRHIGHGPIGRFFETAAIC